MMTITITRGSNSFEYRQREDDPHILEGRATYKGSRWQFIARFDSSDDARTALLAIEARWRQVAAAHPKGFREGKP